MKKGEIIELQGKDAEVVVCENCDHLMVDLDVNEVKEGDLVTLKRKGIRISNPETEEHFCLKCDIEKKPTFREKVSNWFEEKDNDDDSPFFSIPTSTGSISSGGSFGGFGGFGGGGFSGGGASRGF